MQVAFLQKRLTCIFLYVIISIETVIDRKQLFTEDVIMNGMNPNALGYVVVTDYLEANTGKDVSDAIQKVIDENPMRTIYFPDGEYILAKPICTSGKPETAVSLMLSNFAVLKAADGWDHTEAMVRLGAAEPYNTIYRNGSNYSFVGGIVDGNMVANGISIDSGRETCIRNVSIKHTFIGLHVKRGANSGSSDADIDTVNIVGNNRPDSVGVLVEGYDNTFTNMRIGGVHVGFILKSGANSLRNIHPLYYGRNEEYQSSCGFIDEAGTNFFDFCYSDEFATAFRTTRSRCSIFTNCFAYWYSKRGTKHVVFKADGRFESNVVNLNVGIGKHNATNENIILEYGESGGKGLFDNLYIRDPKLITDNAHKAFVE